jgi:hypothetical protein
MQNVCKIVEVLIVVEFTLKVAVAEGGEPPTSKFDYSSHGFEASSEV